MSAVMSGTSGTVRSTVGSTPSRATTSGCAGCGVVTVSTIGMYGSRGFNCLSFGIAATKTGHESRFGSLGDCCVAAGSSKCHAD